MVGALHRLADEGVDLGGRAHLGTRRQFATAIGGEGGLGEDFPAELDGDAEVAPVLGSRHVVEADLGRRPGIGGAHPKPPPRGRAHGADVHLEAVGLGRRLAVVADRHRQEMELDVGVFDAGP